MNKECLVSVIIPVYNTEKYLRKCVDSVVNQTYTNLEIILVDDGSPDNCPEICDEYAEKDNRIVVIHKKNGGLSSARNAGIDYCIQNTNSLWLAFIDSDDWISDNWIERLLTCALQNKTNISVGGIVCHSKFKTTEHPIVENQTVLRSNEMMSSYIVGNSIRTTVTNKLFNINIFQDSRFTEGIIYEDADIMYRLLGKADCISFAKDCFYHICVHQNSITTTTVSEKNVVLMSISDNMVSYYKKFYPSLERLAIAKMINELTYLYYELSIVNLKTNQILLFDVFNQLKNKVQEYQAMPCTAMDEYYEISDMSDVILHNSSAFVKKLKRDRIKRRIKGKLLWIISCFQ